MRASLGHPGGASVKYGVRRQRGLKAFSTSLLARSGGPLFVTVCVVKKGISQL